MASQKQNKTYVGTELKMHIGFSYPGENLTLDDLINFTADFYCEEDKVQHFDKNNNDFILENGEYYAPVDTTVTGPGVLKMKLTAFISDDPKFGSDGRKEVGICTTNVIIE